MKSKRTKALDIDARTRQKVRERDGCCVLCFLKYGRLNAARLQCAHYIGRGQSGLGIPENLVMLCSDCHREYDQTTERETDREIIADHLRHIYDGWDDMRLTYNKWED